MRMKSFLITVIDWRERGRRGVKLMPMRARAGDTSGLGDPKINCPLATVIKMERVSRGGHRGIGGSRGWKTTVFRRVAKMLAGAGSSDTRVLPKPVRRH